MGKQTIVTVQSTLVQPVTPNVPKETRSLLDLMWRNLAAPLNQKSTFNDWQNAGVDQLVLSTMRQAGWFWVLGDGSALELVKAITIPAPQPKSIYAVTTCVLGTNTAQPAGPTDSTGDSVVPVIVSVAGGSWTKDAPGTSFTGCSFRIVLADSTAVPNGTYVLVSYEIIGS